MDTKERGTLPRGEKGPIAPAPRLEGPVQAVIDAVSAWPGIDTTVHWHLVDRTRVDGVDFYVGDQELGHLHLDGSIHLATRPALGREMIAEGVARSFRYQQGWVEEQVGRIGTDAAVALFRRNYDDLAARLSPPPAR